MLLSSKHRRIVLLSSQVRTSVCVHIVSTWRLFQITCNALTETERVPVCVWKRTHPNNYIEESLGNCRRIRAAKKIESSEFLFADRLCANNSSSVVEWTSERYLIIIKYLFYFCQAPRVMIDDAFRSTCVHCEPCIKKKYTYCIYVTVTWLDAVL